MLKNMKIGTKIGLGFGLLIIIAMMLGGIAVVNMKNIAVQSTILAKENVPEVDLAAQIRGASNRIMYDMRGFGFTEEEAYLQKAQNEIKNMNAGIAKGHELAKNANNLKKLTGQLDIIEQVQHEYEAAMEETYKLVTELDVERKALDKNAAIYIQTSNEFLAGQNEAFKRDLAQRQEKIRIVTEMVHLGTDVQIKNFRAQANKDAAKMVDAARNLDDIQPLANGILKITTKDIDVQRINVIVGAAEGYQKAMRKYASEMKKGASASAAVLESAKEEMDKNAGTYVDFCDEYLKAQQAKLTTDMTERHEKLLLANNIIHLGNDTRIKAYKSQALRDPSLIMAAQQNFPKIDNEFEKLRKITKLTVDLNRIDTVQSAAMGYSQAMEQFLKDWKRIQALGETRESLGNKMIDACKILADAGMENMVSIANYAMDSLDTSSTIMVAGLIVALVLGCTLAFLITRGITNGITRVAEGLNEGAEQVAAASSQVSTSSQSLAEGASEQAASVEETSSSLEEMSSMTRQNADNATQADSLMKEANQVVNSANTSMGELINSMEEISKASEETSKIIRTIDEIAFQTNLLALNAAVEAARAGEAGAGFAVVADEVRNLAMRAADAAKNTAGLIEGTVKKVNDGGELVTKTNDAFSEVAKSTARVGELVGEIAAASNEQAQGIGQVNTAVNEVDKVTQQNAASAEESASAAEEMNAQAEQMRIFVGELIAMVNGAGRGIKNGQKTNASKKVQKLKNAMHRLKEHAGQLSEAHLNSHSKYDPEKIIPLDHATF